MRLTAYICIVMSIGALQVPLSVRQGMPKSGLEESGWQRVDAGAFSIMAPSGWKFNQLPGVDSYTGQFSGDGIVLRFDFGQDSNTLKEEKEPSYIIVKKSIGGLRTKVVSPRTPGHGVTGIYFPKTFAANKLCLYGQDLTPSQQDLVLKIFETIRFGRSVPPVVPPPIKDQSVTTQICTIPARAGGGGTGIE